MFTGIIKEVGKVHRMAPHFVVRAKDIIKELKKGDSVSVNGVCLTIEEMDKEFLKFYLGGPTIERTNLGKAIVGEAVNLEPSLSLGSFLSGHIVLGHVDGMVKLLSKKRRDGWWQFEFSLPKPLRRFLIPKASVAIDGVSLTVQERREDSFFVAIVPYTYENTNFCKKHIGAFFNIEVDIIARYLEGFLKDGVLKR